MSEIVSLHIGGSGSRIGKQFWQLMHQQQKIGHQQAQETKRSVFYKESEKKDQFLPRAIYIDTDPRVLDIINQYQDPALKGSTVMSGSDSCFNIFAEGRYLSGAGLVNETLQKLRKQIQICDRFSGFTINCNMGGGNGSGVCSSVLSRLRQNYPQYVVELFNFVPNFQQNQLKNQLEVYNSVLSTFYCIQYADVCILMNNSCIENSLTKIGKMHPSMTDLNRRAARGIIQHIAPYQYCGNLNTNQRKRSTNLLLFPRMKYLTVGLSRPHAKQFELVESSLNQKNRFYSGGNNLGKIYSAYFSVRNPYASQGIISNEIKTALKQAGDVVQWMPHPYGLSLTNKLYSDNSLSVYSLINSDKGIQWLKKTSEYFTMQFRRKAFLYHYTGRGMDQMEFTQAESNCNDLISEYTPCMWCIGDEDNEEEASQQY